jgi:zinc transport system ATP-binding protein
MDKNTPISVREVVLTGRLRPGINPFFRFSKEDEEFSCSLIDKVGLSHLKNRRIRELSGGEYQRMLIARALATNPGLLLLDEPTASVDAAARVQIYELLEELNKSMTIILVTHDLLAISSHVHRLACLNRTLVYHGEPEFNEDVVNGLYGCPVDLIAHGVPHRVLREHGEDVKE